VTGPPAAFASDGDRLFPREQTFRRTWANEAPTGRATMAPPCAQCQTSQEVEMLKAHVRITVALAVASLLIAAAGSAHAAHASRSPVGIATTTKQQGHPSPNYGSGGYGYGRGWCYWHPYQCHYGR